MISDLLLLWNINFFKNKISVFFSITMCQLYFKYPTIQWIFVRKANTSKNYHTKKRSMRKMKKAHTYLIYYTYNTGERKKFSHGKLLKTFSMIASKAFDITTFLQRTTMNDFSGESLRPLRVFFADGAEKTKKIYMKNSPPEKKNDDWRI